MNKRSISVAVPERDAHGSSVAGVPEGHFTKRPRLLVFAYACEPDRGSEPGAGWGVVRSLATFADCTVLVGSEHVPVIRRWESAHVVQGLEFVEVGERWWMPPSRRHQWTKFALYLAWLRRAHKTGLQIHRRAPFDAIYHATYATYWLCRPPRDTTFPVSGDRSGAR